MNTFFFILCFSVIVFAIVVRSFSDALERSQWGKETASGHSFRALPLLNKSEQRVHADLVEVVPQVFGRRAHLLTQVSYGEFLKGSTFAATATINQKRADFVIADEEFNVCCVIEYQGSGHWGRSSGSARDAEKRDGRKREALKSAGIPLVELRASAKRPEILTELRKKNPITASNPSKKLSPRSGSAPLEPISSPNIIRLDQDY